MHKQCDRWTIHSITHNTQLNQILLCCKSSAISVIWRKAQQVQRRWCVNVGVCPGGVLSETFLFLAKFSCLVFFPRPQLCVQAIYQTNMGAICLLSLLLSLGTPSYLLFDAIDIHCVGVFQWAKKSPNSRAHFLLSAFQTLKSVDQHSKALACLVL
jgi:hypothetical protein